MRNVSRKQIGNDAAQITNAQLIINIRRRRRRIFYHYDCCSYFRKATCKLPNSNRTKTKWVREWSRVHMHHMWKRKNTCDSQSTMTWAMKNQWNRQFICHFWWCAFLFILKTTHKDKDRIVEMRWEWTKNHCN